MPQLTQPAPPVPHWLFFCFAHGTHALPAAQQPSGQEFASQTQWPSVVLHSWPVPQATQASEAETPPGPHMEFVSLASGTHALPLQQPTRPHDATLQTH